MIYLYKFGLVYFNRDFEWVHSSICLRIFTRQFFVIHLSLKFEITTVPCRVGLVVGVSASRIVGREFVSRPGHTKDHNKNGANCLPAWHAMR